MTHVSLRLSKAELSTAHDFSIHRPDYEMLTACESCDRVSTKSKLLLLIRNRQSKPLG